MADWQEFSRREMLVAAGAATAGASLMGWPRGAVGAEDEPPRKVLFFTKSAGFQHSVIRREGDALSHAEKIFIEVGKQHNMEVVATKDGTVFDSDLDQFDAFAFYTTGDLTKAGTDKTPPMSADGKKRLMDAVAGGKGLIGSHCASDTFHSEGPGWENQEEPDPYIAMLGGEFISHGAQQEARMVVANSNFPGAETLGDDFLLEEEWYSLKNIARDMHVILVQDTQGMQGVMYERPAYPATWARRHGEGRVFYTSMGHREDVWTNPLFKGLLVGALAWTTGNVDVETPTNLDSVCPGAHVMPVPQRRKES